MYMVPLFTTWAVLDYQVDITKHAAGKEMHNHLLQAGSDKLLAQDNPF